MRKATGVLLGTAMIWAGVAVMLSADAHARADEPTAGAGAHGAHGPARGARGFMNWDSPDGNYRRVRQATDWDEPRDRPVLGPRDDAESRGGPAGFGDGFAPRGRTSLRLENVTAAAEATLKTTLLPQR